MMVVDRHELTLVCASDMPTPASGSQGDPRCVLCGHRVQPKYTGECFGLPRRFAVQSPFAAPERVRYAFRSRVRATSEACGYVC